MTKNYTKNASWEFLPSCKKIQTGRFVCQQKDCSQKIAVRCETSSFFSAESYKVTKLHLKNQGIRAQPEDESEPNGRGTYTYHTSILNVVPFPTSDFRTWIFP